MPKRKRKLTAKEKQIKRERREKFMTIFVNGKQKRIRRPPTVEGIPVEDFITQNADPIFLHQNEMWEYMVTEEAALLNFHQGTPESSESENKLR